MADVDLPIGGAQPIGNALPQYMGLSNFSDAKRDLDLTPQEQYLYQTHLRNLEISKGGVPNPTEGGKSTLYQTSIEKNGRFYNIPTLWDGKFLNEDQATARAEAIGLDNFPSYKTRNQAEARYTKMHEYMERDLRQYGRQ
jgi:hypothetical protein